MSMLGGGIVSVLTLVVNAIIEYKKDQNARNQKLYETKRNNLTEKYTKLGKIINLFPNKSPNDIMKYIEQPPVYNLEKFIPIINSLNLRISYYEERLLDSDLELDERHKLEEMKYDIENVFPEIKRIEQDYFRARNCYKNFCDTDKAFFDLYAGQKVRDSLVEFEVIIHNVFVSGMNAGESKDSKENMIDSARRKLFDSMREDIGIH